MIARLRWATALLFATLGTPGQAAPRAVFVASMGNYRTPAGSGGWGSWKYAGHDPDSVDPHGRRDIASAYYPAIGPYDMSDPDVAEYHCQLLKMAGIDGISFNLAQFQHDPWRQKSMKLYVDAMRRYGLRGIVRFENKFYSKDYPDPRQALAAAYQDMNAWLDLLEPVAYRSGGRPLFMLFTFNLTPEELQVWKTKFPPDRHPIILTYTPKSQYQGVVDGFFGWTGDHPNRLTDRLPYISTVDANFVRLNEKYDRDRAAQLLQRGAISFYMGGVSPGFDDIGCWGWGKGPRKVERDGGRTYRYRWEQMLRTDVSSVLIPTWNDWNEGTVIEPAVEFGNQYLAITRKYAARFKRVKEPSGDLLTPLRIYQVRKQSKDKTALRAMELASRKIAAGEFARAEAIVKPWARKLRVSPSPAFASMR